MEKPFDILDRNCSFQKNIFLEASAGTGKTFAIENLFVRLLMEDLKIDQLLVVTFTRAATKELKQRTRRHLERALLIIKQRDIDNAPDYLMAVLEGEEQKVIQRRLERALLCFDEAQIYTIHGFCEHVLRENPHMMCGKSLDKLITPEEVHKQIYDFFRAQLSHTEYCSEQLEAVFRHHRQDLHLLESELFQIVQSGIPVASLPNYSDLYSQFQIEMERFSDISSDNLVDLFIQSAPHFKKTCDRQGNIKLELIEKVKAFASLFDQNTWSEKDFQKLIRDGLVIADSLNPNNLKCKSVLHLELIDELITRLQPIILKARDPLTNLARMALICQKNTEKYLSSKESYRYDDLLIWMKKLCDHFSTKLSEQYRAVIVDEFQDTDPIQWEIFKSFFNKSTLYLVGDPKQSIYAFRGADIYTYLKASDTLGIENMATLNTNWRSHKPLIEALNYLFSQASKEGFLKLPKLQKKHPYYCVDYSEQTPKKTFLDDRGALHFCLVEEKKGSLRNWPTQAVEEEYLFPFIVDEIIRLKDEVNWKQWAILVKDRYQAKRFADYCTQCGVPVLLQRQKKLTEGPAYRAVIDLVQAILHRQDLNQIKVALGGAILGWTHDQIRTLDHSSALIEVCWQFEQWYVQWMEHGIATCFEKIFYKTAKEIILRKNGLEFYNQFEQIVHQLVEHQEAQGNSPEKILDYLYGLQKLDVEDEQLNLYEDRSRDAVQVLTTHMSKGLEFDLVFALGLASRSPKKERLIPIEENGRRVLVPPEAPFDRQFAEELDAEKMRQLYVAMTRAKWRLYVPIVFQVDQKKEIPVGQKAPNELLLESLGLNHNISEFIEWLANSPITYSKIEKYSECPTVPVDSKQFNLILPPTVTIRQKKEHLYSFSTLTSHVPSIKTEFSPPHDFSCNEKTPQTLPAGAGAGILLHQILESAPIHGDLSKEELLSTCLPFVNGTLFEEWVEVITSIVYNALITPLNLGHISIKICDLGPNQFYREVEFLYKDGSQYVNGVIDLAFQHEGKYYLIDWKSNWLPDYDHDNLEVAMRANQYHLQALLYRKAIEKYFKCVDNSGSFGGIGYVFLRGLSVYWLSE